MNKTQHARGIRMIVFPAKSRLRTRIDWLDSWHSYSFGEQFDPNRVQFGALRVVNDDIIGPGQGFGLHPHANMEIVTIVLSGALEHQDSMGNKGVIEAGEIQYMSAGTGVRHAEFNPREKEPVHLLQIWVFPDKIGYPPAYAQKKIEWTPENAFVPLVTRNRMGNSLSIRQDCGFFMARIQKGQSAAYELSGKNRGAFAMVTEGEAKINGHALKAGDAAEIRGNGKIEVESTQEARVLLIDVPLDETRMAFEDHD